MQHLSREPVQTGHVGNIPFTVLSGGHHKEPGPVLLGLARPDMLCPDGPRAGCPVINSGLDAPVVDRPETELLDVGVDVLDEFVFGEVRRRGLRVRQVRQLAEGLGEVEVEAVVGVLPPQRHRAVLRWKAKKASFPKVLNILRFEMSFL
ncbi:hypothetical protein EJ110_NYTH25257 [Nymphaea thermarum]|nr:hypothetical protein EJ110_NYTH25257 [Nymphaea thermarum]